MQKKPFGHSPDIPAMINPVLTQEKAARLQWLLDAAMPGPVVSMPGFNDMASPLPLVPTKGSALTKQSLEAQKESLKNTEEEMALYVQIALFRYLDLIHRIEGLP